MLLLLSTLKHAKGDAVSNKSMLLHTHLRKRTRAHRAFSWLWLKLNGNKKLSHLKNEGSVVILAFATYGNPEIFYEITILLQKGGKAGAMTSFLLAHQFPIK